MDKDALIDLITQYGHCMADAAVAHNRAVTAETVGYQAEQAQAWTKHLTAADWYMTRIQRELGE